MVIEDKKMDLGDEERRELARMEERRLKCNNLSLNISKISDMIIQIRNSPLFFTTNL